MSKLVQGYEVVIGFETHAQLSTRSKIFSGASTQFGAEPNTQACAVDLALPGTLPVLNREAVDLAVRAALALGCTVHETSIFARKNYFYPDLPKGYQISQYERPLATGGALAVTSANRSGEPTPADGEGVLAVFGDAVAVYLLDEGPLARTASTVVDLAHGEASILRAGALEPSEVLAALRSA